MAKRARVPAVGERNDGLLGIRGEGGWPVEREGIETLRRVGPEPAFGVRLDSTRRGAQLQRRWLDRKGIGE